MQTKKRAKPVKFGKAVKEKKEKEETKKNIEEKKIDKKVEKKVEELREKEERGSGKVADAIQAAKVGVLDEEDKIEDNSDKENSNGLDLGSNMDDEDSRSSDKIEEEVLTEEEIIESEIEDDSDLSGDEIFSKPPDEDGKKKGAFGYFMKVVIITFIAALILSAGGYYAYTNQDKLLTFVNKPSPTPTVAPEPTPTSKPIDLSEFSIRVLNGTDVAGLAGDVKSDLEDAGFNIVSIGNAADDYEETEIQAVKGVSEEFLDKLKEELSKSFKIGETTTISTGEADVIINLGSPSAALN